MHCLGGGVGGGGVGGGRREGDGGQGSQGGGEQGEDGERGGVDRDQDDWKRWEDQGIKAWESPE